MLATRAAATNGRAFYRRARCRFVRVVPVSHRPAVVLFATTTRWGESGCARSEATSASAGVGGELIERARHCAEREQRPALLARKVVHPAATGLEHGFGELPTLAARRASQPGPAEARPLERMSCERKLSPRMPACPAQHASRASDGRGTHEVLPKLACEREAHTTQWTARRYDHADLTVSLAAHSWRLQAAAGAQLPHGQSGERASEGRRADT
jgi:hypothetical protein